MSWVRRRYRGNKAWIRVDATGAPALDGRGLAELRYKEDDVRTYTVRPEEIHALDAAEASGAAPGPPPADAEPVRAYTDGACSGNPGPAGLGVVLRWRDRRREIRRFLGRSTNNEAELRAILVALEAIRRPELPLEVHTDSQYAIGVLGEGLRAKAHVELVGRIRAELARFPRVRFVKVPAHSGVVENERADALAREAVRRGPPP